LLERESLSGEEVDRVLGFERPEPQPAAPAPAQ